MSNEENSISRKDSQPQSDVGDDIFRVICSSAGTFILLLALGLIVTLIWQSRPIFPHIGSFFTDTKLDINNNKFGALAYIYGTLITSALAMLIAVPLGVGSAAYLAEIASEKIRRTGSFLTELLAAIPSVVYGFWGLFFLCPAVQWIYNQVGGPNTSGAGILSAGLILALMIIPYITAITFDVCRAVPRSQREGALALGATRWQMIRTVVLPYARPGIVAACFLALGRALGETMAVTMIVGNRADLPHSWKDVLAIPFALADSIASVIANRLNEAVDERERAALVALGLILFVVTIIVNGSARLLVRRMGKPRVRTRAFRSNFTHPASENMAVRIQNHRKAERINRIMTVVLGSCLLTTVIPLFLILGYIIYRGAGSLSWSFFTQLPMPPKDPNGGMAHAIGGSFMIVGLATLMAIPLGILAAVYLSEYRSTRWSNFVRFVTELLGGVPSIVIGIFVYVIVVRTTGSFSGWAGAIALAIMMVPIIVRSSEESLRLVPSTLRQASLALGASHRQTVLRISLPAALPAIITGIFLAIGRIAGETAPLLLTAYGSNFWPRTPADRTPFLPKYIYDYSRSGIPEWEAQAWAAALVLVVVVMGLNIGIRVLAGKRVVLASRAE
ncbi:phosphate ABC transporter permease PstA [Telmatocola sphagniphila]|uniref:Phosphate transport system permease protein PstA n=1 Tax=Telmatocola sphagniphila TaxID=1123043 RepID=A0A8E6B6C8_9BACT|nr:phosphate ABC transporter permease PstA [Telmatocola sphagniphila]QVL32551.1 phosphate ABC transporter permease PstA [Telmatocola sphagniphila]